MTGRNRDINWTGGRNPFTWDEYDALPPPVRRTLMFALTCLGTRRAVMNLAVGKPIAEVCAIERAVARGCERRDILRLYGPDHPFVSERA